MNCFIFFVFYILVSSSTTGGEGETEACKPTDVFLINCGATSNTSDTTGRTWTQDQQKDHALNSVNASFPSEASKLEWPVHQVPYKTVRIIRSKFTYTISVSPGWKFVRLHFYPTRYGSDLDAVKSLFSVTANGFTLLKNFSPGLTAKGSSKPFVIKEFIVPVLGGHKTTLNLTLTPSPHTLAFINGVEIVSIPNRLYTKGGFDDRITDVGTNNDFEIDATTALETVYRVKVAGDEVPEITDPGMFRQWPSDSEAIQKIESVDTSIISRFAGFVEQYINYTKKTPACVAPKAVYGGTYLDIENEKYPKQNPDFGLTWLFPVDAGFNYLVRLHFCDSTWKRAALPRFSIYIGNKIAKAETDVRNLSGGPMLPMYLDFKTFLSGKSGKRPNLRLDLHPQNKENQQYVDCGLGGIEILKLSDSKGNLSGSNKGPIALHVLAIILIATGSVAGLATFIIVLMRQTKRKNKKDNNVVVLKVLLKQYTYAELKKITKSFSHTLGKGGFGTVYGGNLCDGVKVAVKVMKDLKGTGEDFMNEIASMSQTSHVNIVSLLGFCYEGSKRAIVYEFLENGSLDQFISVANSSLMNVKTLYGIALGIARGLEYLHYGCKTRIVHFDIKPQNILLDGNLCPKLSDFGLAKLCEKRESIVSLMDTRGTIGYIAPEVVSRTYGGVSHKSDVYSFGMLVLDMIGANNKEILATAASNASSVYFPDWVYKELENGEQTWRFGDEITIEEKETAKKMVLIGLWCIKPCPSYRPPMNKVVEMMEGSLDALEIPPKPSVQISPRLTTESSSLSDSNWNVDSAA